MVRDNAMIISKLATDKVNTSIFLNIIKIDEISISTSHKNTAN